MLSVKADTEANKFFELSICPPDACVIRICKFEKLLTLNDDFILNKLNNVIHCILEHGIKATVMIN